MIKLTLEVGKPVDEVFDYFADFRNENEWNVVAHDVRMLTDGAIGPGVRFAGEYQGMGRLEYEIIEYDRPRYLKTHGTSRMMHFVSTFTFSSRGAGTRVDATLDPSPTGLMRVLTPVMGLFVKGQMRKGMSSLRETLEARPNPVEPITPGSSMHQATSQFPRPEPGPGRERASS